VGCPRRSLFVLSDEANGASSVIRGPKLVEVSGKPASGDATGNSYLNEREEKSIYNETDLPHGEGG